MIQIIVAMLWSWEKVFSQKRSAYRAMGQAIRQMIVIGKRTIARSWLVKEPKGDWSSEYKLNNRSKRQEQKLFRPMLWEAINMSKGKFIAIACDDTRLKKSGKKILSAQW